jgi:hypothetical protein
MLRRLPACLSSQWTTQAAPASTQPAAVSSRAIEASTAHGHSKLAGAQDLRLERFTPVELAIRAVERVLYLGLG